MFTSVESECSFDFQQVTIQRRREDTKTITFICNQLKTEYYEFEIQHNNSGLSEMG